MDGMEQNDYCGYCEGTGICPECHGGGLNAENRETLQCEKCLGSCECRECEGTGKSETWFQYFWGSFRSLDFTRQRWLVGGIVGGVVGIIVYWQVAVPVLLFAGGVIWYLHLSKPKNTSLF